MALPDNLSKLMDERLPAEIVVFLGEAGLMAASQGHSLYLVGGVVRDMLLERKNLDLDLASTGNAIDLARELVKLKPGKMTTHSRFQTAKLTWDDWSADIATVRSEIYTRPGALPTVRPGSLKDDLFRRDFTINAMAIELVPGRWGELLDPYGGKEDLEKGLIRILHEDSFMDDATRIWRGLRYEQRLGFRLESKTLKLLKRDVRMLETISTDRLRHELELSLKEEFPEKGIRRADRLGALPELYPGLRGDAWLATRFRQARKMSLPNSPSPELYLALLAYRLTGEETGRLIRRLGLRKAQAQTLGEAANIKNSLGELQEPDLKPSRIYALLHGCGPVAITASYIAAESPLAKKRIALYIDRLRNIKPSVTGADLQELGISPGPRMKDILQRLLEARLDGEVTDRRGEVKLVEGWLKRRR